MHQILKLFFVYSWMRADDRGVRLPLSKRFIREMQGKALSLRTSNDQDDAGVVLGSIHHHLPPRRIDQRSASSSSPLCTTGKERTSC